MMERWIYYEGKKVYLILKNGRKYSGQVIEVDSSNPPIIWMVNLDKFGQRVTFCVDEIQTIEEEREE